MKSKIDSVLVKLSEYIKKQLAAAEKHRDSKQSKGNKNRPKSNLSEEGTKNQQLFMGKIDVLYIIINFPFLPSQLKALFSGGLEISAFFSIIPENIQESPCLTSFRPFEKQNKQQNKKNSIPGQELDYFQNPNCYPPARWNALKPNSPITLPFVELITCLDNESMFKSLENMIIKLFKTKEEFKNFSSNLKLIDLPSISINNDLSIYKEYLLNHPNDFINGILNQLKNNNWNTTPIKPPPKENDLYNDIFNRASQFIKRKTISSIPKDSLEPFIIDNSFKFNHHLLYKLKKWKITNNNVSNLKNLIPFLSYPQNLYCYAGQKFDTMISNINKKYQMGLPLNYFDWQNWNLSEEHPEIDELLFELNKKYSHFEIYLDESIGFLWILVLPPITRTLGNPLINQYFPPTLDNVTEYLNYFLDNNNNNETEKKSRSKITPVSILKNNQEPSILFSPFNERFNRDSFYKLPIKYSFSNEIKLPYVFEDFRVEIKRNILNNNFNFESIVYYKNSLNILSNTNSLSIYPIEDIKVIFNFDYTLNILFYEQSIYFSGSKLILKSSNDIPIIISEDGSLILNVNSIPTIVYPNGMIGRYIKNNWSFVDSKGLAFSKNNNDFIPLDLPSSRSTNYNDNTIKLIRPDGIEYFISKEGKRKIILNTEFCIEQSNDLITYEISNFPVIHFKINNGFSILIDRYTLNISNSQSSVLCSDFIINLFKNKVHFKTQEESQIIYTLNSLEINSKEKIFYVNSKGEQTIGHISQQNNKKNDQIKTEWGYITPIKDILTEQEQIYYNLKYPPKFFLIKPDFTATEFFRTDNISLKENSIQYEDELSHPSGEYCKVLTLHSENSIPRVFIVNESLNKIQRANILQNLHLPKQNKKIINEINLNLELINDKYFEFLNNFKLFSQSLYSYLERSHLQYLNDIEPDPIPEINPPILPPLTPKPNLLKMQQNKYQPLKNKNLNYWNLHESDFSIPIIEIHNPPKPLSPRCKLFDPPLKNEKIELNLIQENENLIIKSKERSIKNIKIEKNYLNNLKVSKNIINFGNIKSNQIYKQSFIILNISKSTIHYSINLKNSKFLEITLNPGLIQPGISKSIQIIIKNHPPENLNLDFNILSKDINIPMKIYANIE